MQQAAFPGGLFFFIHGSPYPPVLAADIYYETIIIKMNKMAIGRLN